MESIEEATTRLRDMDVGAELDVSLSNGLVRSSKELVKQDEDTFMVFHDIDGTCTYFNLHDAAQVLAGKRSPWEGTEGMLGD